MSMEDLLKGLGTFQQGVKDLAISSALKESNQAVAELNAQNLDEADKIAAMNQVGQGLASRLMGAGAGPGEIESVVGRIAQTPQMMAQQAYQDKTLAQNQSQFDETMKYNYAKLADDKDKSTADLDGLDDVGKLIFSKLPKNVHGAATKERTLLEEHGQQVKLMRDQYSEGSKLAKDAGVIDLANPSSEIQARLKSLNAGILERASQAVKGVPSDAETERQMIPFTIEYKDLANPTRIDAKLKQAAGLLKAKAPGAGNLKSVMYDDKTSVKDKILSNVYGDIEKDAPKDPNILKWEGFIADPKVSPAAKAKAQKLLEAYNKGK
jgi:hypothetical protein